MRTTADSSFLMATATMVISAICDVFPDNWRECIELRSPLPQLTPVARASKRVLELGAMPIELTISAIYVSPLPSPLLCSPLLSGHVTLRSALEPRKTSRCDSVTTAIIGESSSSLTIAVASHPLRSQPDRPACGPARRCDEDRRRRRALLHPALDGPGPAPCARCGASAR